jgi:hypothetical protein
VIVSGLEERESDSLFVHPFTCLFSLVISDIGAKLICLPKKQTHEHYPHCPGLFILWTFHRRVYEWGHMPLQTNLFFHLHNTSLLTDPTHIEQWNRLVMSLGQWSRDTRGREEVEQASSIS